MMHLLAGLVLAGAPLMSGGAVVADTLGEIRGQVRSAAEDRPLAHALVEAAAGPVRLSSVTDRDGRYILRGVDAGRWTVRVLALDHAPLEVDVVVPGSGPVVVDLTLDVRPLGLPPIVATVAGVPASGVTPGANGPDAMPRPEAGDAELRALEATPGVAELGLARAAQGGATRDPTDPSSVLHVRGAASDLKLVLLDGAPVYAPFHLAGLMESFHPDVLESSRLFVGGAPARYDGGVSYVLDLRSRPGDGERLHAAGAADLLSVRQRVEGPVGPARVLATGRAIHGSALHERITGNPLPYGYGDALGRVDLPLGPTANLAASLFWNRESVRLDSTALSGGPAEWGNTAASLRYDGSLEGGRVELTAALGQFQTRLPLRGDSLLLAAGRSRRLRLGADYARPVSPGLRAGMGLSYERTDLDQEVAAPGEPLEVVGGGEGQTAGFYGEALWSPTDDLDLRGGVRSDVFLSAGQIRLAPRATATWRSGKDATLSLAVGRFHQYVRTPETILGGDLVGLEPGELRDLADEAEGVASSVDLSALQLDVVGATHFVLGLENQLRHDLRLGVEAFLKSFDRLPRAGEDVRASGFDLWLHRGSGPVVGWVGYSLAFVWTGERPDGSTRFAGRHLLTSGVEARLYSGVVLETRLAYGAGLPFSSIPVTRGGSPEFGLAASASAAGIDEGEEGDDTGGPPLAGAPPGSYLRLDGKLSRAWPARLGGLDVEVVPYVKVLNALDRRDALFFQFDPDRDVQARALSAIPVLPVLGLEWRMM